MCEGHHHRANDIDTRVNAAQPSGSGSAIDRVGRHSGAQQLGSGNDTVLACGEIGDDVLEFHGRELATLQGASP
jgi:hypothetical protein